MDEFNNVGEANVAYTAAYNASQDAWALILNPETDEATRALMQVCVEDRESEMQVAANYLNFHVVPPTREGRRHV